MDNNNSPVFPWQESQWTHVQSMLANDRLPHALLIAGAKGMGILEFSMQFAASLLCQQTLESGENCQTCSSCKLIHADTHPDLLHVFPEEEGKAIKVDQIRKLVGFTQLQSHYGKRKIIVISPAEAMNINSANSLLKTLEEPPGDTLIILLSYQPTLLPITIRSRCQKIKISASSVHVKKWLSGKVEPDLLETVLASGYGPLFFNENEEKVEKIVDRYLLLNDLESMAFKQQDPIDTAERWAKTQVSETFFWLLKICQDMIKLKSTNDKNTDVKLVNQDMIERLYKLVEKYELKEIFRLYDTLFEYQKLSSGNTSLKASTMCEDFTIEWVRLRK